MKRQVSHSEEMVNKHLTQERQRLTVEANKNKGTAGTNRVQNALRSRRD